jgi:hypothetical protein
LVLAEGAQQVPLTALLVATQFLVPLPLLVEAVAHLEAGLLEQVVALEAGELEQAPLEALAHLVKVMLVEQAHLVVVEMYPPLAEEEELAQLEQPLLTV